MRFLQVHLGILAFLMIFSCKNAPTSHQQNQANSTSRPPSLAGDAIGRTAAAPPNCESLDTEARCIEHLPRCEWDLFAVSPDGEELGEKCMPSDQRWPNDCLARNSKALCECHLQTTTCATKKNPPYKRCEWESAECMSEPTTPK